MQTAKTLLFVVAALVVLGSAGLLVIGGGDARWKHEGSMYIRRPTDRVFEWLTEPGLRREWIVGLVESRNMGAQLSETMEVDGRRYRRVVNITTLEEGKQVTFQTNDDGVEFEISFDLAAHRSPQKSRIDYVVVAEYPGWWSRIAKPIFAWSTRTRLEEDLKRFKEQVEAGPY